MDQVTQVFYKFMKIRKFLLVTDANV